MLRCCGASARPYQDWFGPVIEIYPIILLSLVPDEVAQTKLKPSCPSCLHGDIGLSPIVYLLLCHFHIAFKKML